MALPNISFKKIVYGCGGLTILLFIIFVYLMTTVNPPRTVDDTATNTTEDTTTTETTTQAATPAATTAATRAAALFLPEPFERSWVRRPALETPEFDNGSNTVSEEFTAIKGLQRRSINEKSRDQGVVVMQIVDDEGSARMEIVLYPKHSKSNWKMYMNNNIFGNHSAMRDPKLLPGHKIDKSENKEGDFKSNNELQVNAFDNSDVESESSVSTKSFKNYAYEIPVTDVLSSKNTITKIESQDNAIGNNETPTIQDALSGENTASELSNENVEHQSPVSSVLFRNNTSNNNELQEDAFINNKTTNVQDVERDEAVASAASNENFRYQNLDTGTSLRKYTTLKDEPLNEMESSDHERVEWELQSKYMAPEENSDNYRMFHMKRSEPDSIITQESKDIDQNQGEDVNNTSMLESSTIPFYVKMDVSIPNIEEKQ